MFYYIETQEKTIMKSQDCAFIVSLELGIYMTYVFMGSFYLRCENLSCIVASCSVWLYVCILHLIIELYTFCTFGCLVLHVMEAHHVETSIRLLFI